MMKKWKRSLRYVWLRFLRLRATPDEISRGFAFGVFWGMFPLPGLQMAIAILTAAVFRSSKLAAAAGTWLTNPLTTLPITALNFHIGQTVLGRELSDLPFNDVRSLNDFFQLGGDVITSYLMGCLITGTVAAVLSYFLGLPLVAATRRRVAEQRLKRLNRRLGHHHTTRQFQD
ncbi:MAG TPA: DUF2062 domain-containing protein [Crinalium sp.]|jgi:hypothetical protein